MGSSVAEYKGKGRGVVAAGMGGGEGIRHIGQKCVVCMKKEERG